jgi:hypothetical protein
MVGIASRIDPLTAGCLFVTSIGDVHITKAIDAPKQRSAKCRIFLLSVRFASHVQAALPAKGQRIWAASRE